MSEAEKAIERERLIKILQALWGQVDEVKKLIYKLR